MASRTEDEGWRVETMKEDLLPPIVTLNFLVGFFFPAGLLAQVGDPVGKASSAGNQSYPLKQ